jgi:hypothetical protein
VQSFSGLSPLRLATIFYCLSFETSLFVASYDSQGHGGGIRSRLHTGLEGLPCQSQDCCLSISLSHITTDGQSVSQSVSKSWYRAPSGAHDQIFITVWQLWSRFCGAPSLTRGRVCLFYILLFLARAVYLGSESLETRDHILLSQI